MWGSSGEAEKNNALRSPVKLSYRKDAKKTNKLTMFNQEKKGGQLPFRIFAKRLVYLSAKKPIS